MVTVIILMQEISKHRSGSSKTWTVLFLGLLLIIAPCAVRNSLQHALGVKTTNTLNPSKTTIQQATDCCVAYSQAEIVKVKQARKGLKFKSFATFTNQFSNFSIDHPAFFNPLTCENKSKKDIPLYILYKRLKYMI
ncbi:MAG: hypothetical protein Q8N05_21395 [Bacteroidota bacterium]|nr:hypothetical protein [Bacteroidota bacterium]